MRFQLISCHTEVPQRKKNFNVCLGAASCSYTNLACPANETKDKLSPEQNSEFQNKESYWSVFYDRENNRLMIQLIDVYVFIQGVHCQDWMVTSYDTDYLV